MVGNSALSCASIAIATRFSNNVSSRLTRCSCESPSDERMSSNESLWEVASGSSNKDRRKPEAAIFSPDFKRSLAEPPSQQRALFGREPSGWIKEIREGAIPARLRRTMTRSAWRREKAEAKTRRRDMEGIGFRAGGKPASDQENRCHLAGRVPHRRW